MPTHSSIHLFDVGNNPTNVTTVVLCLRLRSRMFQSYLNLSNTIHLGLRCACKCNTVVYCFCCRNTIISYRAKMLSSSNGLYKLPLPTRSLRNPLSRTNGRGSISMFFNFVYCFFYPSITCYTIILTGFSLMLQQV